MAINYAQKYSAKVVERYGIKSLTDKGLNKDYDWNGVKTLTVYSIPTVEMGDYTRSGSNRYGTPTELQDTKQDLTVTKDRAFSITIDKGNNLDRYLYLTYDLVSAVKDNHELQKGVFNMSLTVKENNEQFFE